MRITMTESELWEGTIGYCTACGTPASYSVEPDAREYTCQSCGQNKVYGTEELIFMGLVDIGASMKMKRS